MDEEVIIREQGDASGLIRSIRDETDRRIAEIQKRTQDEIAKREKEYAEEIRKFREAGRIETDRAIDNAIYMLKNRAALEKRKLRLNAIEEFIRSMVDETVSDFIKNDPEGYLSFLKKTIGAAMPDIRGHDITIHIGTHDASLEGELRAAVTQDSAGGQDVTVTIDPALAGGGVILESGSEGISYNFSMARIVSRKYDEIRKEGVKIVQKFTQLERQESD
ncbi:MAG: V-type ATP synthase subunit E [Spirochaetes bacterium]|nr:V-type ATP synthase subunit E [Spirochaetota bacterium]